MAYREFTCVVCGAKAIDRSPQHRAKYCSKRCSNKNRDKIYCEVVRAVPACKYNEGVDCTRQSCHNCGWNPEVEKIRKEAFA